MISINSSSLWGLLMRGNPYMIQQKSRFYYMKASARYIRELASTFQIHPYLSINTAYTKPQHHNKLFNLQKSKTQGVILEKPILLPQKDSKSCQKQSIIERKPLMNREKDQQRHSQN